MLQHAFDEATQIYPPLKLRVFVDDITALLMEKNKASAEIPKKVMKKLKEEVERKGLILSDDEWNALLDAHGFAPSLGGAAAAVAQPADSAEASRRARDKRRRRQREAAKRSMWRDI